MYKSNSGGRVLRYDQRVVSLHFLSFRQLSVRTSGLVTRREEGHKLVCIHVERVRISSFRVATIFTVLFPLLFFFLLL